LCNTSEDRALIRVIIFALTQCQKVQTEYVFKYPALKTKINTNMQGGYVMENYGLLSVLPPVIAIILAIVTKNVVVSLFSAVFIGATILLKGNIFFAITSVFRDYMFKQAADGYNASILVLTLLLGGMVMLVSYSGGAEALARKAVKYVDSAKKAILCTWAFGIFIWFSDFANAMLVGPIFQPITDRAKISREKLAWIVDATSAPICMLVPITGFSIFAMSTLEKELTAYNVPLSLFGTYVQTIPLQFYCVGALLLIPFLAILGLDFGPMVKAQERVEKTGKMHWDHAQPMGLGEPPKFADDAKLSMSLVLLPIGAVFFSFFAVLIANGFPFQKLVGVNVRTGIITGYFMGGLICFVLMLKYKLRTFSSTFDLYISGMQKNVLLILTLLLAWSLSAVCKELGTANYIVGFVQGTLPSYFVAPLIFLIGCMISFATGTSYGTFSILMPIAVPMALTLNAPLVATVAAVYSGGIFGDHCSPISDTTILASMASGCDHIEHVRTQLPYAVLVGVMAFVSYLLSFWIQNSLILLGIFLIIVAIPAFILGRMNEAKS